jgi:hypothetical protein
VLLLLQLQLLLPPKLHMLLLLLPLLLASIGQRLPQSLLLLLL